MGKLWPWEVSRWDFSPIKKSYNYKVNGDFAVKDPTNIDLSLFTKVMESDFKSQYKKSYYTADGPPYVNLL